MVSRSSYIHSDSIQHLNSIVHAGLLKAAETAKKEAEELRQKLVEAGASSSSNWLHTVC